MQDYRQKCMKHIHGMDMVVEISITYTATEQRKLGRPK